jgi:ABC-type cobalamin/Fe3+-siderophores transport system ATPase subunit
VSFRYPGDEREVLHDVSFCAEPGQTVAVLGTTGSGKSTLVNLLPRFYDVTGGSVRLDGHDVREVTLASPALSNRDSPDKAHCSSPAPCATTSPTASPTQPKKW